MNVDLDGGKLLYALGLAFALGAALYFVRDVVFDLSITVKAALLFALFVGAFVAGLAVERGALDVVAFALAALSYAVFLGYVGTRYALEETGVFVLLAVSAALFIALGYAVRERRVAMEPRTAAYVGVALLVVGLALVGADVAGGGVTYTGDLADEVSVNVPEGAAEEDRVPAEARVGTLTATNGFVFTRPLDLPQLGACVVGTDAVADGHVDLRYEPRAYERPDAIGGYGEQRYDLVATLVLEGNATDGENATDGTTLSVERGDDCDASRSEPTLLVDVDEGPEEGRPVPV